MNEQFLIHSCLSIYHSVLCVQHQCLIHISFKEGLLHAELFHTGTCHNWPNLFVVTQKHNLRTGGGGVIYSKTTFSCFLNAISSVDFNMV